MKLNFCISFTASPKEVLNAKEPELGKWIDLSFYEYVDITDHHKVNGYMTDWTRISVDDEGNMFGLSIKNLKADVSALNIDKDREKELLNLKLSDIYTTETTEYRYYSEPFPPVVVIFNGELYIEYFVASHYFDLDINAESSGWLSTILIPVSLLTAS